MAPTLKYVACVLDRLQSEIDCIIWKIIFRRWKSFGQFAEKNDGYDEFSEKKIF